MSHGWGGRLLTLAAVLGAAVAATPLTYGQRQSGWAGVLDEHPSIQYAVRPTTDRAAKLNQELKGGRSLQRDAQTGYLRSLLDALGVSVDSQLLVFSKTGVQSAYTGPRTPRALFFDQSVVVGYIPAAPVIELAAHDPQQGMVFYTLDQTATAPVLTRRTSCLSCHVSATTMNVPGVIARSNFVGEDGKVMPWLGSNDVTHQTSHTDRWGGWFVTSDGAPPPLQNQRAHAGNITFSGAGNTSNQIFVDWLDSAPETRGYVSSSSDIVALLLFDHQAHAINLMTRLNWEARVATTSGEGSVLDGEVQRLANELGDYFLFVGEAPPAAPLTARPSFAERLAASTPKDRQGRACGQLDLVNRMLRYPCSYLVYSEAFDGLAPAVKSLVYRRMVDVLSRTDAQTRRPRLTTDDRRVVLEILRETKVDFPGR